MSATSKPPKPLAGPINHPCICGEFGWYGFKTGHRDQRGRAVIEWFCGDHKAIGQAKWRAQGSPGAAPAAAKPKPDAPMAKAVEPMIFDPAQGRLF